MPRQASAAAGFATGTSGTRMLLKPPEDLDQLERTEFANLITGAPANHFLPSDVPLLAAYAKAIVAERVAAGELAAAYVIDDKPSPWLPIWQAKVRALTTLARMLSLSPGGRVASKPSDEAPISYYERMSLLEEGRRDDDPN
jgi:hypothetical protein